METAPLASKESNLTMDQYPNNLRLLRFLTAKKR